MANGHKILITEAEVERENRGMTEYEKHVERRARAIDTECWNYGDLPTVAAESAFAEARMAAYAQARATMEADRAAGYALVPVEATEAMLKASSRGDAHRARGYWRRMVAAGDILPEGE